MRLHHVQVACPRGGARFRSYDAQGRVGAEVHVGVEEPFAPARKAHPAFVLDSPAEPGAVGARLTAAGFDVDWTQRDSFPGHQCFHTFDARGNRVEVLAPAK